MTAVLVESKRQISDDFLTSDNLHLSRPRNRTAGHGYQNLQRLFKTRTARSTWAFVVLKRSYFTPSHWMAHHPVEIELSLHEASPENRSFLEIGWRFSGVFAPEFLQIRSWRPDPSPKPRHWRAFQDRNGNILQNAHWLAGAGGFEPPHGGIKIPCLTTWRRPNSVEQFTALRDSKSSRRNSSV